MEKERVLKEVENIFRDILDEESLNLRRETTANDIDGWDSLTHIQLIVAIEKQFKVKFSSKEILSWKNVGELLDSLKARANS
ncbi:MAG: acyl carrier protein [Bacteroidales bacterium]|nr:acyl carrier protein [Bacteroidales bacterium]